MNIKNEWLRKTKYEIFNNWRYKSSLCNSALREIIAESLLAGLSYQDIDCVKPIYKIGDKVKVILGGFFSSAHKVTRIFLSYELGDICASFREEEISAYEEPELKVGDKVTRAVVLSRAKDYKVYTIISVSPVSGKYELENFNMLFKGSDLVKVIENSDKTRGILS